MADINSAFTITFDEQVKGWTSFHSFLPDWMDSLNGEFYTIKDGQLYIHHDESNLVRNNFYGEQFNSVLDFVINQAPSDIKFLKAVNIEGNKAMEAIVVSYLNDEQTDITRSTISVGEFLNKEGKFYAYVRRNELTNDYTAKNAYGIGQVDVSVGTSEIIMQGNIPLSLISVGDEVYDAANTLIGNVVSYDSGNNQLVVDTTPTLAAGTFLYGLKSGRIEGSEIRGYNFAVTLTDSTTDRLEIFAFNSEVAKSFPS
jgi:hypothetical protein